MIKQLLTFLPSNVTHYYRDTIAVFGGVIIGKALAFLLKIVLAKLGIEYLGLVEVVLNTLTILIGFSLLGFPYTLIRFITQKSKGHDSLRVESIFYIILRTCLLISVASIFVIHIFPQLIEIVFHLKEKTLIPLVWVVSVLPFMVMTELSGQYFNAQSKIYYYTFVNSILTPALRILLLSVLWLLPIPIFYKIVLHLLLALIISGIVSMVLTKVTLRKVFTVSNWDYAKSLYRFTFPISFSFLFFVLFTSFDIWILSRYHPLQIIGEFAVLVSLVELVDFIILPFLNRLPILLGTVPHNIEEGIKLTTKTIYVLIAVAVASAGGVYLFQKLLLTWLFNNQLEFGNQLIALFLGLKLVQSLVILPSRHILDYYGHVRLTLYLMAASFLVKVFIGWFVVPIYGLWGVALMTGAAHAVHVTGCTASLFFLVHRTKSS